MYLKGSGELDRSVFQEHEDQQAGAHLAANSSQQCRLLCELPGHLGSCTCGDFLDESAPMGAWTQVAYTFLTELIHV